MRHLDVAEETNMLRNKSTGPFAPALHKPTPADGTVAQGVLKFRRRHIILLIKAIVVFEVTTTVILAIFGVAIWFL